MKTCSVPFQGTKEQEAQLLAVIEELRDQPGSLMPIMQKAQEIYGYLPIEVIRHIAFGLEVPVEEVYGVASFYSQFTLNPKGDISIAVCLGTACYVKGSGNIIAKVSEVIGVEPGATSPDGKYSLDATRCVGACGLAPVMTINNDVYGRLVPSDVKDIIAKYQA